MKIKNRNIGDSSPIFIIAELSANHNQKFELAVKTIKAAKKAGADAIKLQTYTSDTITIDVNNKYFTFDNNSLWKGETLYNLYKKTYTPWEWHAKLKKLTEDLGLIFFSSPFDKSAVDFLDKLKVPAFKIASPELNDLTLVEYIASKKKPIIMSTGMSDLSQINDAVKTCYEAGNREIAILKCTSMYPTPFDNVNLLTIPHLKQTFNVPIGLSDHTVGTSVSIASVALGAKIIERHFMLDKTEKTPDIAFSLDSEEFSQMVKSIREVEKSLGKIDYSLPTALVKNKILQRSLFIVEDIKKGDKFSEKNVKSIRPGYGLSPNFIREILGKIAKEDIKKGTPLTWSLL